MFGLLLRCTVAVMLQPGAVEPVFGCLCLVLTCYDRHYFSSPVVHEVTCAYTLALAVKLLLLLWHLGAGLFDWQ